MQHSISKSLESSQEKEGTLSVTEEVSCRSEMDSQSEQHLQFKRVVAQRTPYSNFKNTLESKLQETEELQIPK